MEKTRNVHARASSSPPPSAMEDIAAIEGMGSEERVLRVWRRWVRKLRVLRGWLRGWFGGLMGGWMGGWVGCCFL